MSLTSRYDFLSATSAYSKNVLKMYCRHYLKKFISNVSLSPSVIYELNLLDRFYKV